MLIQLSNSLLEMIPPVSSVPAFCITFRLENLYESDALPVSEHVSLSNPRAFLTPADQIHLYTDSGKIPI